MKFVADENFDNRILRGLLRRLPTLDIVRVQDLEIAGAKDLSSLLAKPPSTKILLGPSRHEVYYISLTDYIQHTDQKP